jgi:hypothetical protein
MPLPSLAIPAALRAGWNFVGSHWRLIAIGAALAFAGWQTLRVAWAEAKLASAQGALAAERTAHAATRGSLDRLEHEIGEQNKAIAALAAEGARRKAAASEAAREAMRANEAQAATIAGLRESAGRGAGEGSSAACPVSGPLAAAEGL